MMTAQQLLAAQFASRNSQYPTVILKPHERELADWVGAYKQAEREQAGAKDNHGFTGDPLAINQLGAAGELAFCKFKNCWWSGMINSYKEPDCGYKYQIRTRDKKEFDANPNRRDLLVRLPKFDNPKDPFVLVIGDDCVFQILGWIWGHEAQLPQFEFEDHRGTCYFYPHQKLRDLKTLP